MHPPEFQTWMDSLPADQCRKLDVLLSTPVVKKFLHQLFAHAKEDGLLKVIDIPSALKLTYTKQIARIIERCFIGNDAKLISNACVAFDDFQRSSPDVAAAVIEELSLETRREIEGNFYP